MGMSLLLVYMCTKSLVSLCLIAVTTVQSRDLIALHHCYTQLWQLCYLVLNVPLYLLLSTKVHAILQKQDKDKLRHSTVWTTLKEQLPPVLEEYKARLLWSLMPPIMVGALNWLVDSYGLPAQAELPVAEISTTVFVA